MSAHDLSHLTDEELYACLESPGLARHDVELEAARRLRASDSARAPALHELALAYLEAEAAYWNGRRDGDDDIGLWDAHIKAEQAWRLTGCAIWQTPPASPSTESAQAQTWASHPDGVLRDWLHSPDAVQAQGAADELRRRRYTSVEDYANSHPPSPLSTSERAAAEAMRAALDAILRSNDPKGGCLDTCACVRDADDDCDCGYVDSQEIAPWCADAIDAWDRASREPAAPCGDEFEGDSLPCVKPYGHDGRHEDEHGGHWPHGWNAKAAQGGTILDADLFRQLVFTARDDANAILRKLDAVLGVLDAERAGRT